MLFIDAAQKKVPLLRRIAAQGRFANRPYIASRMNLLLTDMLELKKR